MISFTLTSRFWRYTGYSNYIYLGMYKCNIPLPENELGASSRPIVAQVPFKLLGCPHGARLWNRSDAPAKSRTALTVPARETVSGLPLSPSVEPPSRLDTLLNACPTLLLSFRRISLRFGQSTSTWVTVSCAPHTHWSLSRKPKVLA